MSKSKEEEIIAVLWTILFVLLCAVHADAFWIILVGMKAFGDHVCSIYYGIKERRDDP